MPARGNRGGMFRSQCDFEMLEGLAEGRISRGAVARRETRFGETGEASNHECLSPYLLQGGGGGRTSNVSLG